MESFEYLVGKYLVNYSPGHGSCTAIKIKLWLQDEYFIATFFDDDSSLEIGLDHHISIDLFSHGGVNAIFNNREEALIFIQKLTKLQEVRKASAKFLLSDLIPGGLVLMDQTSED